MKKPKYIINKNENNKITWIKINKENGTTKTEILDMSKDEQREIKVLNKKYTDLLEKYENEEYQESTVVIKNLKVSKWTKLISGATLVLISTTATLIIEEELLFHKLMSITSFLGSYLIANGFDIEKEIKKLSETQIEILLKKEKYTNKQNKGKNIEKGQLNKYTLSAIIITALAFLSLEISASLTEIAMKQTKNIDLTRLLANIASFISGIALKKGTNAIVDMTNFDYDKEDYILTQKETEILEKEKKKIKQK